MRKLQFTVEIEFEDKITQDNEIQEVSNNMIRALSSECRSGEGLAPEASETFTRKIKVTDNITHKTVSISNEHF